MNYLKMMKIARIVEALDHESILHEWKENKMLKHFDNETRKISVLRLDFSKELVEKAQKEWDSWQVVKYQPSFAVDKIMALRIVMTLGILEDEASLKKMTVIDCYDIEDKIEALKLERVDIATVIRQWYKPVSPEIIALLLKGRKITHVAREIGINSCMLSNIKDGRRKGCKTETAAKISSYYKPLMMEMICGALGLDDY